MKLVYKINKASQSEIYSHLSASDENFIPPLSSRVNLSDYTQKIFSNATTFEAWDQTYLVGILNTYFNDFEKRFGFITNVSVLKQYMRKGIASKLLWMCLEYGKDHGFQEIRLEVSNKNFGAISLYVSFGFKVLKADEDLIILSYDL